MRINTKPTKIIAILLIVITSVCLFPACSNRANQIVDKEMDVMQSIQSYNISYTSNVTAEGGSPGNTNGTVTSSGNGIIDEATNAFEMDIETNSNLGVSSSTPNIQNIKIYMSDNIVYENTTEGGSQAGWTNHPATSNDSKQISFVDIKKIQNLLVGTKAKILQQETIEGSSCYVLDITADPKKLFDITSEPGMVSQDAESISYWDNIKKDFSFQIWVSKDTYNLIKMEYEMSSTIAPQYLGQPTDSPETKTTVEVSALFSGINEAVPVVVPAEALAEATQLKQWISPPSMQIDSNKQYTATIGTNLGNIEVQLFANEDPVTVNNFVFLANQGYYNGCKFFRIVKGFVIQAGDPTNTGAGGPGYQFDDETMTRNYLPGTLAMANAGPNTDGSQFFICLVDLTTQLPKNYVIFGIVNSGMDIVQSIGNIPVVANPIMAGEVSSPTQDVHINTIEIAEKYNLWFTE